MPSSYTASLRFNLQATGESINLWGEINNAGVVTLVDKAIAGWSNVALSGATYSLTVANGSADEARSAMLKFTGAPTTLVTVTVPAVSKSYTVWNACGQPVRVTTGSGAVVDIDNGDIVSLIIDGTNVKALGYGGLTLKQFIAASVLAATGSLPAVTGNAGKFVYTDGVNAYWKAVGTTDLEDYKSKILGVQVALGVAL